MTVRVRKSGDHRSYMDISTKFCYVLLKAKQPRGKVRIPKRSSKHFMIITPAVAGDIWVWTADKNVSRGEKACWVQQQCRVSVAELMNTVSYVCVFLDDTENTACFLVSLADFWVKYPALLKLNLWVCLGLNMSYILLSCVLISWYSPWHQSGYQLSHC